MRCRSSTRLEQWPRQHELGIYFGHLGASPKARRDVGRDAILTRREVEILRLVAEGLTDGDIAARLVLSKHTVHRHLQNAYARLGCSSRAAAVTRANKLHLL